MLARWKRSREKTPPPPKLPRLYSPQGKPDPPTMSPLRKSPPPKRPRKHPALAEAQRRAARLLSPRPLRLERPELHRSHDHPNLTRTVARVSAYIAHGETPGPLDPAPYEYWVLRHKLDQLDASTSAHRWDRLFRINDVRDALGIARQPRAW